MSCCHVHVHVRARTRNEFCIDDWSEWSDELVGMRVQATTSKTTPYTHKTHATAACLPRPQLQHTSSISVRSFLRSRQTKSDQISVRRLLRGSVGAVRSSRFGLPGRFDSAARLIECRAVIVALVHAVQQSVVICPDAHKSD